MSAFAVVALFAPIEVGTAVPRSDYWHAGYRPHITLRAGESLREGDGWPVRCFGTVQLTEEYGTIVDVVNMARV